MISTGRSYMPHSWSYTRCFAPCFWRLVTGRIVLSNRKRILRKYLVVFLEHFPKKRYLANPNNEILYNLRKKFDAKLSFSGGSYRQIFEKLFHGIFVLLSKFLPEICWEEVPEEIFSYFRLDVWSGIWTWTDLTSNRPTHYL